MFISLRSKFISLSANFLASAFSIKYDSIIMILKTCMAHEQIFHLHSFDRDQNSVKRSHSAVDFSKGANAVGKHH